MYRVGPRWLVLRVLQSRCSARLRNRFPRKWVGGYSSKEARNELIFEFLLALESYQRIRSR